MKRRVFLRMSSLAGAAAAAGWPGAGVLSAQARGREYYELRVYEMPTGNRKAILNDYLSNAAIPAWNRMGIGPVGVFTVVSGSNALMLYVLIPYPDLATFESAAGKLASDAEYQKAAAPYLGASIDNPAYTRYEGWLLHAFKTIPRLRVPAETPEKAPRIFELRVYESHSEAAAAKKIEMFNEGGEIALFDRIGLRPVFFGQTLAGPRQPNLVYMTVHRDMAAREKVWETFRNDEGWKKLSTDPAFANTVSATTVIFLRPAAYSQI
ncbi:MAG: NIPSNAP family containing protein [Acidobacteria bacterium]|nr:MAG: NIPSNAP family containing protein [Acidobacteriota bacterium]